MSVFVHSQDIITVHAAGLKNGKILSMQLLNAPLLHTQMKYFKFFFCSMLEEKTQHSDISWDKCESCLLKPDKIWYQHNAMKYFVKIQDQTNFNSVPASVYCLGRLMGEDMATNFWQNGTTR